MSEEQEKLEGKIKVATIELLTLVQKLPTAQRYDVVSTAVTRLIAYCVDHDKSR